jgi:hypothetical protein
MKKHYCVLLFCLSFILFIPHVTQAGSGILEVYSEPTGAKVYIDSVYVGKTPYQNVEVPTGKHRIKALLSKDFPPQEQDIVIDEVNPQIVKFKFQSGSGGRFTGKEIEQATDKFKGNVSFASIPTGAIVIIDGGARKTKTPKGFTDVEVGRYKIEFQWKGKSLKGHFDVIKNETVKLIADFNKEKIFNKWEEERENKRIADERQRKELEEEANLRTQQELNADIVRKFKSIRVDLGSINQVGLSIRDNTFSDSSNSIFTYKSFERLGYVRRDKNEISLHQGRLKRTFIIWLKCLDGPCVDKHILRCEYQDEKAFSDIFLITISTTMPDNLTFGSAPDDALKHTVEICINDKCQNNSTSGGNYGQFNKNPMKYKIGRFNINIFAMRDENRKYGYDDPLIMQIERTDL